MLDSKLERNLIAFHWLPLEQWTPDRMFNQHPVNGKFMCKVCDRFITRAGQEDHINEHVEQEKNRRREKGETIMEDRKEAKAEVSGQIVSAFDGGKELTLIAISEATGVSVPNVRNTIKSLEFDGKVVVAGQKKSGGRGRPANIYKLA